MKGSAAVCTTVLFGRVKVIGTPLKRVENGVTMLGTRAVSSVKETVYLFAVRPRSS